ncbi:RNA polymerase sigma factor, sigma-70 family [Nonomuraea maritima]|uniref:RNA polymerase sigma factor, sigma-70 family n=1 Tax=Nonomuraea maritima TaxID=683260 RepID=A0A1G9E9I9_9ACTN|nr:sigma-70 family RNA polymerase sigma factor [Nonomuraea maritima]SDK72813.1 RNA polymerase sigma factor, sigma-70 family [Nonomuraea maritima]
MNDRVLVEALRARDRGALTALYDAYAESLYRYCWSLLLSADSAQVALRDTLIAAEAHAGALTDPSRLRTWLYALARAECLRRRAAAPPGAREALAEAPPLDDPADADLRVIAWNAVQSLPVADREILELVHRHSVAAAELAQVLGIPARQVEPAMEEALERLHDAITAEVLARKGSYDCPRRARILSGFSGELTQEMREHLVRHLTRCETCAPHRTRQVSAAKVFQLLPQVALPEALRIRVMSCFIDPELLPYRRYVARRTSALGAAGFPVPVNPHPRRWPQAVAGALAAVATVVAIALIFDQIGRENGGVAGVATAAFPPTGEPPGIRLPWQADPHDMPLTVVPIVDRAGAKPTETHPGGVAAAGARAGQGASLETHQIDNGARPASPSGHPPLPTSSSPQPPVTETPQPTTSPTRTPWRRWQGGRPRGGTSVSCRRADRRHCVHRPRRPSHTESPPRLWPPRTHRPPHSHRPPYRPPHTNRPPYPHRPPHTQPPQTQRPLQTHRPRQTQRPPFTPRPPRYTPRPPVPHHPQPTPTRHTPPAPPPAEPPSDGPPAGPPPDPPPQQPPRQDPPPQQPPRQDPPPQNDPPPGGDPGPPDPSGGPMS